MRIYINVPNQVLKIDDRAPLSIGQWPYIVCIRKLDTVRFDTETGQGFASWQNPNTPGMDLSNPVYAEFVGQLVSHTMKFANRNNVFQFPNQNNQLKVH